VLCNTITNKRCATEWVLDSGCTYHKCPYKDSFSTYMLLDSGVMLVGNDAQCNVVGIGTIHIKTYDGILRTLTNIHHILDLKRNLIEHGTLKSNGCRYSAEVDI